MVQAAEMELQGEPPEAPPTIFTRHFSGRPKSIILNLLLPKDIIALPALSMSEQIINKLGAE